MNNNLVNLTEKEIEFLLSLCAEESIRCLHMLENIKRYNIDHVDKQVEDRKTTLENIHNKLIKSKIPMNPETNEFVDNIVNHKGGLESKYVRRVRGALGQLDRMWFPPTGGFIDNGVDYQGIDFIISKTDCYKSLIIAKKFIDEFAPDIKEE